MVTTSVEDITAEELLA